VGVAVGVAAAAIAGSLSLNRKMILRVPKKLGDEDEEVIRIGDGFQFLLEESQNKNWDSCSLFFIREKDQDIERLKRGGCYERKKQRGKGKQEGAAEKPQREEKDEEGEEEQIGLEEALGITSLFVVKFILEGHP